MSVKRRMRFSPVIFIVLFALIGTAILVRSFAVLSSNAKISEAEGSVSQNDTTAVADGTASGNTYVQFNTIQVSPPGGNGFCDTFPSLPASKPDATNTGVPSGTVLSPSGDITVTTDGTVIDAKDISGGVYINANNVTIKNSKIHGTGSSYMAVRIADGKTGARILSSEIYTTNGGYEGIIGGNFIACGNYIRGFDNAFTIGGNTTIQSNFIEKLNSAQSGPHYDGIELYSGSNVNIWGNNIRMTDVNGNWLGDTGAINLTTEWSSITNVEIRGNWIGGGGYTLYIRRSSSGSGYNYSGIRVINNRWYGSPPKGFAQWGPMSDDGGDIIFTGNVWDSTNQPI